MIERAPDELLPFAGTNASPSELWQLGHQSLADGWQLARAYFRAALNRLMDTGIAWGVSLANALLDEPLVVAAIRFIKAIGRETTQATQQLTPVLYPIYQAALRWVSPIRSAEMRHWLMALLVLDGALWVGLLGLFGVATAEGNEALSATEHLALRSPITQTSIVTGQVFSPAPTLSIQPTATPLPMPTATPIPLAQSVWQPSLPAETGWSGAETCSGEFLAPTGTGYFIWPINQHYLSGYDYSWWHAGVDIAAQLGDPIYAADSGLIVYAGWNTWGYGNLIVIDHGNGWHTLYAHLSQLDVTCGQAVEQGAVIGWAGSTGHSTGPHLHFEMRFENEGRVNPWLYLP